MARVFDALRRAQKYKKREGTHDPLAQTIQVEPEAAIEQAEELAALEAASRIGTPTGPRSNEGMLLPGAARSLSDPSASQPMRQATATPTQPVTAPLAAASAPESERPKGFQPPETLAPPHIAAAQVRQAEIHPRLLMLHEPQAPGCEQYRTLRTELFHAAERELTQVIVLTSAVTGEGKTATTLNLALAIAQSPNRRVLVIDGDLRRPNIAAYLALKPFSGFAEVLEEKAEVFDALSRFAEHELYVLPVRREPANPTELLSSKRFQESLRALRQHFDFILIDSPPVKPFADTRLLANHADAVLFVVRSGFASYETVEEAVQALAGQRMLGVVLNGADDVQEVSSYEAYQTLNGHGAAPHPVWSALAPKLRTSWLGRKLKF
jgi:protein-tyrosine kinase